MKSFVPALALATAVAAEADPQTLLVQQQPLLKSLVPQQVVSPVTTYTTAHVQAPVAHTYAQPLVYNAPAVATQQVQYIQPAEVKYQEVKPIEAEKKVEVQTYNYVQQQPLTYAAAATPVAYAQTPLVYNAAAVPAKQVYHAKNGAVEHTVINKREAEPVNPVDYVHVQKTPYSSVKIPTLEKTLRAYNKYPVATAPVVQAPYVAAAAGYTTAAQVPYVNNFYANQYVAGTPYVAAAAQPYQYVF